MKNPFELGQEVSGYRFYDRKQVTKELRQKIGAKGVLRGLDLREPHDRETEWLT